MRSGKRITGKWIAGKLVGGLVLAAVVLGGCGADGGESPVPGEDVSQESEGNSGESGAGNSGQREGGTGSLGQGESGAGSPGQAENAEDAGENLSGAGADDDAGDPSWAWEDRVLYGKGSLLAEQKEGCWLFGNGMVSLEYDIAAGTSRIFFAEEEEPVLSEVYARTVLEDGTELASKDMIRGGEDAVTIEEVEDGFGKGICVRVLNRGEKADLTQCYFFYDGLPYFFCEAAVSTEEEAGVSTNYIAPVFACKGDYKTNVLSVSGEDVRFLFTPYDNDAFVRYSAEPLLTASESYEVTAIYDNAVRKSLVAGSVTHDTWKTGIKLRQGGMDATVEFSVYGGASSAYTRDSLPHGFVSGREVASPRIFLGYFSDYRDGMETFGRANAVIAPSLAWDKGIPMGWNSWSAVADKVSYAVYTDSSDFVKENLQDKSFSQDGTVYINFDSFWDNLTEKELKEAAQHVRDGQPLQLAGYRAEG